LFITLVGGEGNLCLDAVVKFGLHLIDSAAFAHSVARTISASVLDCESTRKKSLLESSLLAVVAAVLVKLGGGVRCGITAVHASSARFETVKGFRVAYSTSNQLDGLVAGVSNRRCCGIADVDCTGLR
jgi:hypothetical protein